MNRVAFLGVVVLGVVTSSVYAESPVYFADANLKAAVESRLGLSDPTPSDMLSLTWLQIVSGGITDLTGLEYATNLTYLYLEVNQISDISPLSGLTKLTDLLLGHDQISDISALSGLTNLNKLTLYHNELISDISPLSGVTNLMTLYIGDNQVSDISVLSDLTHLAELGISSNPISDISALSGLTNLTDLYMSSAQISDISAISGLTRLRLLSADYNQISNISALAGLARLDLLYLYGNQIGDISPLTGLMQLTRLDLERNPLNNEAYCIYLPQIRANNPGANITCSPNGSPPSGVSASDGIYSDKVRIAWDSLCGITQDVRYQVYRSESSGGTKIALGDWQFSASFDDTTALPDMTYYYWVMARIGGFPYQYTDYSWYDTGWCGTAVGTYALTTSSTAGGSVTVPGEGIFSYDSGSSVLVVAVAATNHDFTGWTGAAVTAGKVADPGAASTTVTMDADYTLMANFSPIVLIDPRTVTVSSSDGGAVSVPGEGEFQYEKGTSVSILANAKGGYLFWGWTGTAVTAGKVGDSTSPITSLTMDDNYTLCANFVPAGQVSVLVLTPNGGESLTGGTVVPIQWQVEGPIERVNIELSLDGGSTWARVSQPSAQGGTWDWLVPTVNSSQCLIRIRAAQSADTSDISDAPFSIQGIVWYVDAAATGAADGTSWQNAFVSLQDGLARASADDSIWVAEGLYWPDLGASQTIGDRAATLQLKSGVAVYGGFPTGGGTWRQRNSFLHQTILSGDIGEPGVLTDNSYHVVTTGHVAGEVVLDGCVITCGFANGAEPHDRGGGMHNQGSLIVRNCTFAANAAVGDGGAAYNSQSSLTFINCVFTGNTSGNWGGGMCNTDSAVTVISCTFTGNQALWRGGGIYNILEPISVTNSIFWGNARMSGTCFDERAQLSCHPVLTISHCCVQSWTGSFGGESILGLDPLFVDADGPDNIPGTCDDDLQLQDSSPCLDAGDNASVPLDVATDLQGHPRISGSAVDIGAYESGEVPEN